MLRTSSSLSLPFISGQDNLDRFSTSTSESLDSLVHSVSTAFKHSKGLQLSGKKSMGQHPSYLSTRNIYTAKGAAGKGVIGSGSGAPGGACAVM